MSESDIIAHLAFRNEMIWSLVQWWVSISFAIVVASYFGANRLSRLLVTVIIALYLLYTLTMCTEFLTQMTYIAAIYKDLTALAESTQTGFIAQSALDRRGGYTGPLVLLTMGVTFLVTIGFVVHCYRKGNVIE